jgi:hypothetical protein
MTCIVWHKGKLYADSYTVKENETFQSLTKITQYVTPVKVVCTLPGFDINDRVFAWTGSGGNAAMKKFADWLEIEGANPDAQGRFGAIFDFYTLVADQQLVNGMGNLFEIFFVGEQYNHSFRLDYTKGFSYQRLDKNESVFYGSGHQLCLNFMKEWQDPVRAMLETFFIDPASGGMIEIWGWREPRPEDVLPHFHREGIVMDIPKEHLRYFLDHLCKNKRKPIPPHYIRKGEADVMLARAAKLNLELEETIAKQARLIARLQKQLGIVPAKKVVKKPAAKKVEVHALPAPKSAGQPIVGTKRASLKPNHRQPSI